MPWRTIDGRRRRPKGKPELEVLLKGVFDKARFLDLIRHFIVFEVDGPRSSRSWRAITSTTPSTRPWRRTVAAASPQG